MQQDVDLSSLVEAISQRVQTRLHEAPSAASSSTPDACAGVGPNCDECRGCHVKRAADVREVVHLGAVRVAAGVGHKAPAADLAPFIDHTLLKADATRDELKQLCDEAKKYGFATVCVNAANVRFCAAQLDGSRVKPIAVVGFPLGAGTANAKAFETREAVRQGAQEIDMVINIGALKNREYALVLSDIQAVVSAASPKPVKVIIETALLEHDQKVIACSLAKVAGATFVKTSTGFGPGGATAEDVALMRAIVGPEMGVKASGGVRNTEDARTMMKAGANRLGASASVSIVSGDGDGKVTKVRRFGY